MMKYIYTLVITFAVWNTVVAQEGVRFRDLAFNEALAQAKAEDKLVFMDCYTSWCAMQGHGRRGFPAKSSR